MKPAELIELAFPPGPNLPKFCTERAPDRIRKLMTHPLRFAELHGSQLLPERERRRMTPMRPSARRGVILVWLAFTKHMDVPSRRVGRPRSDGTFTGIGHDDHVLPSGEVVPGLISETGLTPTQFRRYVARGRRAGYWTAHQHRDRYWNADTGEMTYSACRVVYQVTELGIERLGLTKRLEKDARKIHRQRCERPRRIYPGPLMGAASSRRRVQPGRRSDPRGAELALGRQQRAADQGAQLARLENFERNLVPIKLGLRQKHPDWGADRIDKAARDLLGRRS